MADKKTRYARWLTGNLSPEERSAMEASGELQELEAIRQAMQKLQLPDYHEEKALQNIQQRKQKQPVPLQKLTTYRQLIGIAATLLLALALGLWLWLPQKTTLTAQTGGEPMAVILPDGSTVLLNDGSTLEYNQRRWARERLIQLTGEAFFSVRSGSPFEVSTLNGQVRVLGTTFNVQSWDQQFKVECYEGRVELQRSGQSRILTATESGIWQDNQFRKGQLERTQPAWQLGLAAFEKAPLRTVLAEFERQYAATIITQDIDWDTPFSGAFTLNNREDALEQICTPLGLNYRVQKKRILLSRQNR